MSRRDWIAMAAGTLLGVLTEQHPARAMDRPLLGGTFTLVVPYALDFDPFDLFSPSAALFAHAIATPILRMTKQGTIFPSACEELPRRRGRISTIRLRPGLRAASGRPLVGRDVVEAVRRARRGAGKLIFRNIASPNVARTDRLVVEFPNTDPRELGAALASPLLPLVQRRSRHGKVDGSGGFVMTGDRNRIVLRTNRHAIRGAAFLDRVIVERAGDLAEPLRRFEARQADVGWLGEGLHAPRPGTTNFDMGTVGWFVLVPGRGAGQGLGVGQTQQLLDGIAPQRLAHLGLRVGRYHSSGSAWKGPSGLLVYRGEDAHMAAIARTLARVLSRPGHELQPMGVEPAEWGKRVRRRDYVFRLEFVRRTGPLSKHTVEALASADDAWRVPESLLDEREPRRIGLGLHLGVVGALHVAGSRVVRLKLGSPPEGFSWDLSETTWS